MTSASDTVLGKKAAKGQPARARSAFSPAMLDQICLDLGVSLAGLYKVKTAVTLESVGVEPYRDAVDALAEPATVGFIELNGTLNSAKVCFDPNLVFHTIDVMLGGEPEATAEPAPRPSTELDDRFCKRLAENVIGTFSATCNDVMGAGTVAAWRLSDIKHAKNTMELTVETAEVLCVRTRVQLGQGERSGLLELHVPLTTIDALSKANASGGQSISMPNGPWFEHMRDSVLEMELDAIGILHTEKMSVADISRLDIGSVITIPGKAIAGMPLVLEDGGDVISEGELGSASGKRIMRLSEPPNAKFLEPLRQVLDVV